MFESIKRHTLNKIAFLAFILLVTWWVALHTFYAATDVDMQAFAAVYGVMALIGAIGGFRIAKKWGYTKSLMGKAICMFALGLFAQEFGQLVYSFYIYFLHIDIPYPSIGDIGFFGSIPLYIYGTLLLARASGIKVSLKSLGNQIYALVIPVLILGFSYYMFLQGYEFDWSAPVAIFLDFGYPLGQAIYVSLALLTYILSRRTLGGVMRSRILWFLFALAIQYMADYTFLYQAAKETWVAGGINDLMYLVSYFVMTMALFNLRMSDIKQKLARD
jgi:hypothetical protein